MSVSSTRLGDNTLFGYKIEKGGPNAVSNRLHAGIQRVNQQGETPASGWGGYSNGSPQENYDTEEFDKPPPLRKAGDKLVEEGLLGGEFARKIDDEGPLRDATGRYMEMLLGGGFSPIQQPMAAAPPEETA